MRPRKMLLSVCDADCSTLLSMSGMRNNPIVRQIGLESSIAGPRRCIVPVFPRPGTSFPHGEEEVRSGGRLAQRESVPFTRGGSAVRIRHRPNAACCTMFAAGYVLITLI